jgi:formylglycine-generating enzyme required for sulfatase activity
MMRNKPWTPVTLREVGGTKGIAFAFLEETFSSGRADPRLRRHERAVRVVLGALLPDQGTDIKGNMKSHETLLKASGYEQDAQGFEELLGILDKELRLITPTEPIRANTEAKEGLAIGERYYQLTHDYLIAPLWEWLTQKETETWKGWAKLRLADRSAQWNARPETRHLPAWWEGAIIRLLTRKGDWTPPQRKMMRNAGRYHAVRGLVLMLFLLLLSGGGYEVYGRLQVESIVSADTSTALPLVEQLSPYHLWANARLRRYTWEAPEDSRKHLCASLALLRTDDGQVEYLYGRLLRAGPTDLPVIRDALKSHRKALAERLWSVLDDAKADPEQQFRATCALATYDDGNRERWAVVSPFVADRLLAAVRQNPSHYTALVEMLRPVRDDLLGPLSEVYRSRERPEGDRSYATSILAEYATDADHLAVLADLLMGGDEKQFAVLYPKFQVHGERGASVLNAEVDRQPPADVPEADKETLAKRQANAAVALLKMGEPTKVWPLLKHPAHPQAEACGFSNPRVRSYLIHRLSPLGADPRAIVQRLDEESDVSVRRALLLALGEFGEKEFSSGERDLLVPKLLGLYRDDADAGLHGAAEWLLLQWGQQPKVKVVEDEWQGYGEEVRAKRQERLDGIRQALAKGRAGPQWYVNGQGQTMVVLPGPVEFLMGSPPTEADRLVGPEGEEAERQHMRGIGRSFAIAAREVTVKQFGEFLKSRQESIEEYYNRLYSPTADCPVNCVLWYDAAAYCNWLSEQEGIPDTQWCYEPKKGKDVRDWSAKAYGDGMRLAPDYLHRAGYRLPSEAEWEYACRAGAVTSRYYGETEELLGKYAWYTKNSQNRGMLPGPAGGFGVAGGRLKPNDFGLFDMLGNALEWCQDSMAYYPTAAEGKAVEDVEDTKDITDKLNRVLRGGSFFSQPRNVRSADRNWNVPTTRFTGVGFRPARTFR